MSGDPTLPGLRDFRLRRPHEKSRNGCVRCKQQRKKCDELRPSCSRCAKRMHDCRYQSPRSEPNSSEGQGLEQLSISDFSPPRKSLSIAVSGSGGPFALSDGHLSVSGSSTGRSSPISPVSCFPRFSENEDTQAWNSHSPDTLDATELSLLNHYLTHTSQTIPFDNVDLYALSVGIPNLALKSKPVMSSLLALAAACKCHDIAKKTQTPLESQTLVEIQELLTLADRHHRSSLEHIQAAMSNSDWYDNVLANAALMVLYTSASHSIRVHLAATAKRNGQQLPREVLPQHSQWISFTRAAHTASTAVLNDMVHSAADDPTASVSLATHPLPDLPRAASGEANNFSPQGGPSESTKRLFLPLVAYTYSRAFEALQRKAESTAALFGGRDFSTCNYSELQACLETLPLLEKCASDAVSARENNGEQWAHKDDSTLFGKFSGVSPWVGRYMVSVTSMTSPKALRRTIMSFLNKAPTDYLNIVQSVLDSSSGEASPGTGVPLESPDAEPPSLSVTHLLAMDIFAHWLVLVMLLDGVWWIDNIGQWELGQVVSLIKSQNWLSQSQDARETWWPESMYLVKRELNPNI